MSDALKVNELLKYIFKKTNNRNSLPSTSEEEELCLQDESDTNHGKDFVSDNFN